MSVIAVIPARGGSKGVPHKNIKELCGKPLISYTIKAALDSGIFDKVIVSTDDPMIAEVSKKYGAEIPFLRPDNISGDMATSDDVMLHALKFYEENGVKFDEICKLQPTSPLRTGEHIVEAYNQYKDKDANFTVSICECEHSPLWCGTIDEDGLLDNFLDDSAKRSCRQQLSQYYRLNGAIYLGKVANFVSEKTFLGKNCVPYIMSQESSIDIDSNLDFLIAETIMNNK